jgi:hypothetical protein
MQSISRQRANWIHPPAGWVVGVVGQHFVFFFIFYFIFLFFYFIFFYGRFLLRSWHQGMA